MRESLALLDARKLGYDEGVEWGISQGIAQGRSEGMQQGLAKGSQERAREAARNFLALGVTPELVAKGTNLSLSEVLALQ